MFLVLPGYYFGVFLLPEQCFSSSFRALVPDYFPLAFSVLDLDPAGDSPLAPGLGLGQGCHATQLAQL